MASDLLWWPFQRRYTPPPKPPSSSRPRLLLSSVIKGASIACLPEAPSFQWLEEPLRLRNSVSGPCQAGSVGKEPQRGPCRQSISINTPIFQEKYEIVLSVRFGASNGSGPQSRIKVQRPVRMHVGPTDQRGAAHQIWMRSATYPYP